MHPCLKRTPLSNGGGGHFGHMSPKRTPVVLKCTPPLFAPHQWMWELKISSKYGKILQLSFKTYSMTIFVIRIEL